MKPKTYSISIVQTANMGNMSFVIEEKSKGKMIGTCGSASMDIDFKIAEIGYSEKGYYHNGKVYYVDIDAITDDEHKGRNKYGTNCQL